MFSLSLIFIVNAFVFMFILEERFKMIPTLIITAIGTALGFISNVVANGIITESANASIISNAICVFWLLIASIISSSNNIAQKLFVALLLITNYSFITDFSVVLLGITPVNMAGNTGSFAGNILYVLFSLIIMAIHIKPLRYMYRRLISPYSVILCLLQYLAFCTASGKLNDYLGTDSFSIRFFSTLVLYIFIAFAARSVYGAARYKSKDYESNAQSEIDKIRAESYNAMVVNVESYKATKKNVVFAMNKLGSLAEQGRNDEIVDYVKRFTANPGSGSLIENYSDNPYINAIIATKATDAASKGVKVETNINLGDSHIKVIELCMLIDDVLTWAIHDALKSSEEEKFVRMNVLPASGQLAIETVHTTGEKTTVKGFLSRTFGNFFEHFFELKDKPVTELKNVREIANKYSGSINISEAGETTITRIGINYK